MFFQFSPVRAAPQKKPVEKTPESEKIDVLTLGPFAAKPKIVFQDVIVGTPTNRKLLIRNPLQHDVNVFLIKHFHEDVNVTFNWEQNIIEKTEEKLLEITWSPDCEYASRHMFSIEDGKRLKIEIPIILKSVSPKTKKTGTKVKLKLATKKAKSPIKKVITSRRISPVKKPSPKAKHLSPSKRLQVNNVPGVVVCSPSGRRDTFCIAGKENKYKSPRKAVLPLSLADSDERRQTFTVSTIMQQNKEVFNDSLEMISPESYKIGNRSILSPLTEVNYTNRENTMYTKQDSDFGFKLESVSFKFSPTTTPVKYSHINDHFSAAKSVSSFAEKINELNLCSSNNITFNFQTPHQNLDMSGKLHRLKLSPIDNTNISTETYVKGNASFETYVKGNLSASTYVKDTSIGDIAALPDSPVYYKENSPISSKPNRHLTGDGARNIIEANMWTVGKSKPLKSISEVCDDSFERENVSPRKPNLKRKSDVFFKMSPMKKAHIDNNAKPRPSLNWSKSGGAAMRIARSTSGLNLTRKSLMLTESKTCIVSNPFLLAATNMIDPFMTSQVYCDEEWIDKQINEFKKWLNALLTPPAELETKSDGKIDVAKVWNEVKNREVAVAPTKETISIKYHTSNKLNSLRKAAQLLFRTEAMSAVLSKVVIAVDSGKLSIREDRDIHLNLALKSELMSLLLSYNTLWLRIGLETIYNEVIPLHSNADVTGLSHFIVERLFKDPYLFKKHKTIHSPKYTVEFKKFFLKKFLILVYFLDQAKNKKLIAHDPCLFCTNALVKESREILVRLAKESLSAVGDITKSLKYIGYVVTHKQTFINEFDYAVNNLGVDLRDGVRLAKVMEIILLREGLTAGLRVPAISRLQKVHNMKLVFNSLEAAGFKILYDISAKDIVDGHKEKTLSFLWQIIYKFEAPLMVKSSTTIQKWFRSLPIVLKRRKLEKIRLEKIKAATKIQLWYRRQILSEKLYFFAIMLKHHLEDIRREKAALAIQSYYRMYRCRKVFFHQRMIVIKLQTYSRGWLIRNNYRNRIVAANKIQSKVRAFIAKKSFLRLKKAVVDVQRRFRALRTMRERKNEYVKLKQAAILVQSKFKAKLCRIEFEKKKKSAIAIQSWFRSVQEMRKQRQNYLQLKIAAVTIASWYKSVIKMREAKSKFVALKKSVSIVEERYLAKKAMLEQKTAYERVKHAAIAIQQTYRAIVLMRIDRRNYCKLRKATIVFQRRYRARRMCIETRTAYLQLKSKVIFLQRLYRANKEMAKDRDNFVKLKKATIKIQNWYRSIVSMRNCRSTYILLKTAVKNVEQRYLAKKMMRLEQTNFKITMSAIITVQQRFKALLQMRVCKNNYIEMRSAAITIQSRYKANKLAEIERNQYLALKKATLKTQSRFRANCLMKSQRREFLLQKTSVIKIQIWYKSLLIMRKQRNYYISLKASVLIMERLYLAQKSMQIARNKFLQLKNTTTFIQRQFRANLLMKKTYLEYSVRRKAIITIQRAYRAKKAMLTEKNRFRALKNATIILQRQYRAQVLMKKETLNFQVLKKSVCVIQQRFRANKKMKEAFLNYQTLKTVTINLQRKYRAKMACQKAFLEYQRLKRSTIVIQRRYRSLISMRIERQKYLKLRESCIFIQALYKAKKLMLLEKTSYIAKKNAVLILQRKYRAQKLMTIEKKSYQSLRKSAILIQQRYRARKISQKESASFQALKKSAIVIQECFRAKRAMEIKREEYLSLKKATINIQTRYRAILQMRVQREYFITLKCACITVQQRFRSKKLMEFQRGEYNKLRTASVTIQQQFRAQKMMKTERINFVTLRKYTILIQEKYRAVKLMEKERKVFLEFRSATITIQQRYRALKYMQTERRNFLTLKQSSIVIQKNYRAKIAHHRFQRLRESAILIQQKFRATLLMKEDMENYQKLKKNTILIQQRFRANKLMKEESFKYQILRNATIKIQQKFRSTVAMKKERSEFMKVRRSTILIQQFYFGYRAMKCERQMFLVKRLATIKIQSCVKGFLIRRKFASYFSAEAREERRLEKIKAAAATKIQAMWRGHRTRSKEKNPVIAKIRGRSKQANANAVPQNTLKHRCEQAVNMLVLDHVTLLQIIRALEDIEYITRRCRDTCKKMSEFLPDQLYLMISYTARSLPEMTACTLASQILINFCKYSATKEKSFVSKYMDNLITVMLNWCDKEAPLFPTICTLLWLFAHNEQWKKEILNVPHLEQRILKINTLTSRKMKMVERTGIKGTSNFGPTRHLHLPSTLPDWGLQYEHRPHVFKNSVHALKSLLHVLNLH